MIRWIEEVGEKTAKGIRGALVHDSSDESSEDYEDRRYTTNETLAHGTYTNKGTNPRRSNIMPRPKNAFTEDLEKNLPGEELETSSDDDDDDDDSRDIPKRNLDGVNFTMPTFIRSKDYLSSKRSTIQPLTNFSNDNSNSSKEESFGEQELEDKRNAKESTLNLNFLGPSGGIVFGNTVPVYDPDEEYRNESVLSKDEMEQIGLNEDYSAKPHFKVEQVYFAFLTLNPSESEGRRPEDSIWHWLNQFVSSFTEYIHCEVIFMVRNIQTGKRYRLISSIHRSHELRLTTKEYKPRRLKFWRFFHYDCDEDMKKSIFNYEKNSNHTPFNKVAFMWNFLVPFDFLRVDCQGERVFCSEQICRNLKNIDPHKHSSLVPYSTHPYALLHYMLSNNNNEGNFNECEEPKVGVDVADYV